MDICLFLFAFFLFGSLLVICSKQVYVLWSRKWNLINEISFIFFLESFSLDIVVWEFRWFSTAVWKSFGCSLLKNLFIPSLEEECESSLCTSALRARNLELAQDMKKMTAVFEKLETYIHLLALPSKFLVVHGSTWRA